MSDINEKRLILDGLIHSHSIRLSHYSPIFFDGGG